MRVGGYMENRTNCSTQCLHNIGRTARVQQHRLPTDVGHTKTKTWLGRQKVFDRTCSWLI